MAQPYCEKFGFDDDRIHQRLRWLDFSVEDHVLARRLQMEVIRPNITAIVNDFYDWLDSVEEVQEMLSNGFDIGRLKITQTDYVRSLGMEFDTPEYFESRLRVGQAHAWIGLNLSLYNCAYYWLSQFIIARFPDNLRTADGDGQRIETFLHKIVCLDISLAIETYHVAKVTSLEETLAHTQQQKDRLRVAASTDSLTGLANHDAIIAELEMALTEIAQGEHTVAVVMADLDHFKDVNDTYGHLAGDKVLTEVSRRLRAALRGFDRVGRYGGEEFLLILHNATPTSMKHVTERVRKHITDNPVKLPELSLKVTMSMGVTMIRSGETAEDAIARADTALYAAKKAGRDRIVVA
ncbi:MAG: diguanylate cyclase [Gammaproteobacteria bacterium]|nr:diguanylate cyclase [Gammaproteobacteria bacterium]MCF6363385.1 diguanylate cyclase [Gammaproteobacteria bacterium]